VTAVRNTVGKDYVTATSSVTSEIKTSRHFNYPSEKEIKDAKPKPEIEEWKANVVPLLDKIKINEELMKAMKGGDVQALPSKIDAYIKAFDYGKFIVNQH
jgi:hypothetical protein